MRRRTEKDRSLRQNVMYVLGVAANLISMSKATEVASMLYRKHGDREFEFDREKVLVAPEVGGVRRGQPDGERAIL